MQLQIKYAKVKHGRVRLTKDGDLNITIPTWKKNDPKFQQELILKGKQLLKRSKKQSQISFIGADYVMIFANKKNIPINQDLNIYLKDVFIDVLEPILDHYCKEMGINYNKFSVKNLKSKWGSCSSNKNLSINLKLVHLAVDYTEYVVVHELAHIIHPNHSQRFRNFVGEYIPDYKKLRKELKKIVL